MCGRIKTQARGKPETGKPKASAAEIPLRKHRGDEIRGLE
jgi:hypothetical protein